MAFELVEVQTDEGQTIYVQVDRELQLRRGQSGFESAGPDELAKQFDQISQYVAKRTEEFVRQYQQLAAGARPSKVALEFAIGVEGSAGIPFLASGKSSANITITAEWSPSTTAAAQRRSPE